MKWTLLLAVLVILLTAYLLQKKNKIFNCLKCNFKGKNKKSECPVCGYSNKSSAILKSGAGGGYD